MILNFAAPIRGIPYESLSLFFSFDINVVNGITDGVKFSETHSSSKLTMQVFFFIKDQPVFGVCVRVCVFGCVCSGVCLGVFVSL